MPPSGFVTLLMTDVEGSTTLVQRVDEHFAALIEQLWAVLRSCVSACGGHEVEARADEFFAVFESPRAAVDSAIEMQRVLPQRTWPGDADVRVRIGIHSGYPTSTASNYVGLDVNTTSRVCALGHGGQIVVSANTREAVKASGPAGREVQVARRASPSGRRCSDRSVPGHVGRSPVEVPTAARVVRTREIALES